MRLHAVQYRGGLREIAQEVSAALVEIGPEGRAEVRWQVGEDFACFWRSGCKPMQLHSSLSCLSAEQQAWFDDGDLALGAASHSGEPEHVARVLRLLRHFHLKERQLRCGAHWPMYEPAARVLMGRRRKCTAVHSNCSGKHTFMLAAAQAKGWDLDYLPLSHPLQQQNLQTITGWCGQAPGVGVDGCGVPSFHLPITAMAQGFARLAAEMHASAAAEAAGGAPSLAGRIGWAMHRQPHLMSGTGRLDRRVVQGATEPLTVKVGAEGLFSIALPERRQGLVIKVHGGSNDLLAVAVPAVLEAVAPGVLPVAAPGSAEWPWNRLHNIAGLQVGERRAEWSA